MKAINRAGCLLCVAACCAQSLVAMASDPPADGVVEKCGVLAEVAPQQVEAIPLPSLRVAQVVSKRAAFVLPADAPQGVVGILCGRETLLPLDGDDQVPRAGYPFSIIDPDGRVAVLEIADGQMRFRASEGEFAEEEMPRIRAFLRQAQKRLDAERKREQQP